MAAVSIDRHLAIDAALLDLDGTLVDTAPDLHAAACAMLRDFGRAEIPIEHTRKYVGKGMRNLVKRLLAGSLDISGEEPPDAAIASFRSHYARENGRQAACYPGALEGLDMFQEKGIRLAMVTNKPVMFTRPLLDRLGLTHYFEVIVGGDSLPRLKPDPMPVIWACGRLGVSPAKALFIGDSVNDFLAARAAGCPAFMLPYGYNEGRSVDELDADAVVSDIRHAAEISRCNTL